MRIKNTSASLTRTTILFDYFYYAFWNIYVYTICIRI